MKCDMIENLTLITLRSLDVNVFFRNNKNQFHKFDYKGDEGLFIGYTTTNKAYRVKHERSLTVEEPFMLLLINLNFFVLCKHI